MPRFISFSLLKTMWIKISQLIRSRPLVKVRNRKLNISYFSTETYVVGTQKNRLKENGSFEQNNTYVKTGG